MEERIIRVMNETRAHGIMFTIVETAYEFGRHYVLLTNGMPGFHSKDYDRVERYMYDIANM